MIVIIMKRTAEYGAELYNKKKVQTGFKIIELFNNGHQQMMNGEEYAVLQQVE